MRRSFHFEPINRGALWAKLNLTAAQLAALCNLTTRQVSYWAQKGYLPRAAHNAERFNGNAVDMCLLMKQALDSGASLAQAAQLATTHLAAELGNQPQVHNFEPPALFDFYEKLSTIETIARALRGVVEPQLPRADAQLLSAEERARDSAVAASNGSHDTAEGGANS